MFASHLHIVPRLKMSRAILLLPLYAYMSCMGTTLHFYLFMISSVLAEVQTKQLLNTATPTSLVLSVTDSMSVQYMSTYSIPGVVAAL